MDSKLGCLGCVVFGVSDALRQWHRQKFYVAHNKSPEFADLLNMVRIATSIDMIRQ